MKQINFKLWLAVLGISLVSSSAILAANEKDLANKIFGEDKNNGARLKEFYGKIGGDDVKLTKDGISIKKAIKIDSKDLGIKDIDIDLLEYKFLVDNCGSDTSWNPFLGGWKSGVTVGGIALIVGIAGYISCSLLSSESNEGSDE